jgi:hypothetical protein
MTVLKGVRPPGWGEPGTGLLEGMCYCGRAECCGSVFLGADGLQTVSSGEAMPANDTGSAVSVVALTHREYAGPGMCLRRGTGSL